MKILHLLPQGVIGGAEMLVLMLAKAQVQMGHELTMGFLFAGGPVMEEARSHGMRTTLLTLGRSWDFVNYPRSIRILKRINADVIHCHLASIGVLLSVPQRNRAVIVHHEHGAVLDKIDWRRLIDKFAQRCVRRFVDAYIAVSEKTKQQLITELGIPSKSVWVIPNGIDIKRFKNKVCRSKIKKMLGFREDQFLIGTVGRLVEQKGIDNFLRVASIIHKEVPSTGFIIVGDGPQRKKLRDFAEELKLNKCVKFLGMRTDIPNLLSAFDLFLLTSKRESFGIVIVEAMAKGVPVLAFGVDGVPDVIDSESGILIAPGDVPDMAEESIKLMLDDSRRQGLSNSGILRAGMFSIEQVAIQTLQLYDDIITARIHKGLQ